MLLSVWSVLSADLVKPRPNDRHVTSVVTTLIRREHLSKHPLDNEISERGLKAFLQALDPMKMYFLASDADEFMKRQDDLDEMLMDKDISFAYTIFERFLTRVDERVKLVNELLSQKFDFAADESLVTDPEAIQYARDGQEIQDRWRRRIKYDLLVLKGDKTEGDAALEKLRRRYQSFAKRMHQTDADELLEMYLTSITTSYDPHTSYMSPSSVENFRILMRLNLEGIGAALQMVDGYTVVSKIIPGGAADKQGKLKPEDRIVSVSDKKTGEMVDVVDMKLNDVVDMIRGKAGTVVKLGVIPTGSNEVKVYSITRATIELKDSEARREIIQLGTKANGAPLQIGVIDLPSFYMDMEGARNGNDGYKSTTRDVRKILDDFTAKGVDVVVHCAHAAGAKNSLLPLCGERGGRTGQYHGGPGTISSGRHSRPERELGVQPRVAASQFVADLGRQFVLLAGHRVLHFLESALDGEGAQGRTPATEFSAHLLDLIGMNRLGDEGRACQALLHFLKDLHMTPIRQPDPLLALGLRIAVAHAHRAGPVAIRREEDA